MTELARQIIKREKKERTGYLDLGNCGLREMPDLSDMDWLETLILSNRWVDWEQRKWIDSQNIGEANELSFITEKFFPEWIKTLILGGDYNNLWQISEVDFLEELTNLTSLNLIYNQISNVDFLAQLPDLTMLSLSSNQIRDFSFTGTLPDLTTLDLSSNQIKNTGFLGQLPNLTTLDLRNNRISHFTFLGQLPNLTTLNLSSNQISEVVIGGGLSSLTTLDLSSNQTSEVVFLEQVPSLTTLDLYSNQISEVVFLGQLPNLITLDLSSNQIKDFGFLGQLPNLTTLDLSDNQISDIAFLGQLPRPNKIELSNNQLTDLTLLRYFYEEKGVRMVWKEWYEIADGEINVKGNPLTNPPVEIVQQGNRAILNYFAEKGRTGTEKSLEAKVVLIGEGQAGKTSLRTRLLTPGAALPNKEDRTKGLDIEIEKYKYPLASGEEMRLNLFDFGGQDHYKPLHRFFYSKNTLYVLVSRNGDAAANDFDYWLDTVQVFGKNSPVLLVHNLFGDVRSNFNRQQYARFDNIIKGSIEVNLGDFADKRWDNVRQSIEYYASCLPHVHEEIPKSWANVRRALTARREEQVLDLEDYLALCALPENGEMDEARALRCSAYLHDIGIILHYQDDADLREYVIVKNEWATDAAYRVIEDAEIARRNGHFFRQTDLPRIWCQPEYRKMRPQLLQLMRHFRLCYPLKLEGEFIAPQLLPASPPEGYDWVPDSDLVLYVEYDFMPPGLMAQLIVECHLLIAAERRLVWRDGAVLELSGGEARAEILLQKRNGKQTIGIRAQGPKHRELMTIADSKLEELHRTFGMDLKVEKKIPCICPRCKKGPEQYFFNLSELEHRRSRGRMSVECLLTLEDVSIDALLGNVFSDEIRVNKKENDFEIAYRLSVELITNAKLSNEKSLKISNVNLLSLPKELGDCVELDELDLSGCSAISDLAPVASLSHLKVFKCQRTDVSNLSPLRKLTNLKEIDFSFTKVSDLSPLKALINLQKLNCASTEINTILPISSLVNLEYFDLSFTKVDDLSPISNLNHLKEINCESTLVNESILLTKLSSLEYFNLNTCPIKDCPSDIYQIGDPKVLNDFFNIASNDNLIEDQTQDIRRDVKLILLGNSASGKTTLLHYLKTGKYLDERESTHGLQVYRWDPDPVRFPFLADITVSVWDFGGQEYYHGAYRLFMSNNAVYLLIWDTETDCNGCSPTVINSKGDKVSVEHFEKKYWLDTIRHFGGEIEDTQIIVIQNKVDLEGGKKRIDQLLHDKFGINESFHLSVLNACKIDEHLDKILLKHFEIVLARELKRTADGTGLPLGWNQIRQAIIDLQDGKKNTPFDYVLAKDGSVSLNEFEIVCAEILNNKLNTDGRNLANVFQKGGVVFFIDSGKSIDRVYLKPSELVRKIYEILERKVLDYGGEFMLSDIFDENHDDFRDVFIEVAKKMGLIFLHPDSKKSDWYIAPQYLRESHPIEDLYAIASYGSNQSGFYLRIPIFFYKKLMHSLILFYASKSSGSEVSYFWRHGIVFVKNGVRAIINGLYLTKSEREGVIHIRVQDNSDKKGELLEEEVFWECLRLIVARGPENAGLNSNYKEFKNQVGDILERKTPKSNDFEKAINRILDECEVSKDNDFYVSYIDLHNASERRDIRVKCKDKKGQTEAILVKRFSSLLVKKPLNGLKVFVSYSHANTLFLNLLRKHLDGLRRSNAIEIWTDQEILPGDQWDKTIKEQLLGSDLFILLISADFFASNYIWDIELKSAISAYRNEGKIVIPVLVEPVDLGGIHGIDEIEDAEKGRKVLKIQDFEIVPKTLDGKIKPISLWESQDEAMAIVSTKIRELIYHYRNRDLAITNRNPLYFNESNIPRAFFSYSKNDTAYLKEFKKHLSAACRNGDILLWDDTKILPGEEWDNAIKQELAQADLIFMLVSVDFLNTDYIWDTELPEAILRHEAGEATVIPIKIRDCNWSGTPLSKFQGLPRKDGIIGPSAQNDAMWTEVVKEIQAELKRRG